MGLIGKGSFGEVYLVQRNDGKQQVYAMKVLHKSRIMSNNYLITQRAQFNEYALTERNVLSITSHPFIVKLRCAF
jgi:serine/threonine protein kinase